MFFVAASIRFIAYLLLFSSAASACAIHRLQHRDAVATTTAVAESTSQPDSFQAASPDGIINSIVKIAQTLKSLWYDVVGGTLPELFELLEDVEAVPLSGTGSRPSRRPPWPPGSFSTIFIIPTPVPGESQAPPPMMLPGTAPMPVSAIPVVPVQPPVQHTISDLTVRSTRTIAITRTVFAFPANATGGLGGGNGSAFPPFPIAGGPRTSRPVVGPVPFFVNTTRTDPFLHIPPTSFPSNAHFTIHMPIPIIPPTTLITSRAPFPTHPNASGMLPPRIAPSGVFPPGNRSSILFQPFAPSSAPLPLLSLCTNPSVRTISLPLIQKFFGTNNYPALQPFPGCESPNPSQAFRAPDLLNCTTLGREVQACQALGKRVILSLAGSDVVANTPNTGFPQPPPNSNLTWHIPIPIPNPLHPAPATPAPNTSPSQPNLFASVDQAREFAATIWSLFGAGEWERADLRPLGPDVPGTNTTQGIAWVHRPLGEEVVLDGVDVQIPTAWRGSVQEGYFGSLLGRLKRFADAEKGGYQILGLTLI